MRRMRRLQQRVNPKTKTNTNTNTRTRTRTKTRFALLRHPTEYGCVYNYNISPDAPPPEVAPVGRRDTPYTEPPTQCFVNQLGTLTCLNQANKFLDNPSYNYSFDNFDSFDVDYNPNHNQHHNQNPHYNQNSNYAESIPNPNRVDGGYRVSQQPPDSPLNRILTRPPTGPWTLVGYVYTQLGNGGRMLLYAQTVDQGRNRYNYRAVDRDGIPIDVAENAYWIMDGDQINVEQLSYVVYLYQSFR